MSGVLVGFSIILTIIAVGYLIGKIGLITVEQRPVLNRVAFYVATPALLFTVMIQADVSILLSPVMLVSASSVLVCVALYLTASRLFFRRPLAETTLGAAAASYVNANNIGLPVAIYVLADPSYVAPVLLMQLLIFAPIILGILDISTSTSTAVGRMLLRPLRNPIIVSSALGVLLSVLGVHLPDPVLKPFEMLGGAAIPLVLLAFGISLNGQRPLQPGTGRRDIITATAIKSVGMPLVAWALGAGVFHLTGHALFAAVTLAALPSAQNIYNFAATYNRAETVARDTVLLTTILAVPVIFVIAWLLAA
ncbi:AEC family transporter [Klugiella xanthotipulae]|uniref:AEC family transporter n=1 Tax=Klugiella xanthotipulae TaxID=244735 RepID=A0A543I6D6_9MICO|nr:AEC family transporter [Klugiella xanthotipulae]TQM66163.1 hypothetical protein FB466_0993 [Klugiella xanthotipulae]